MNHMICKGMKSLMFSMLFLACAESQDQGTLQDYNRAYAWSHQCSADSVFHWARATVWCDSSHVLHYQVAIPNGK